MIPKEKIIEIKKKLKKGCPQGELINDLIEQGYSPEEIQDAMYALSGTPQTSNKPIHIPLWYAVSIGFIILGIAILSVKYLWIYYYGYFFLAIGIIGFLVKFFIDNNRQMK